MRVEQGEWTEQAGLAVAGAARPQWVLCFGPADLLVQDRPLAELSDRYPEAHIVACSAGGAISGSGVLDDAMAFAAVEMEHASVEVAGIELGAGVDGFAAGRALGGRLPVAGLVHVLVFAPGLNVNASEILAGLRTWVPAGVGVTGGLASDGTAFARTVVRTAGRAGTTSAADRRVVAIGFYGAGLRIGYGSMGGWDPFGPDRVITRSQGNVLFELDGRPALSLYEEYLGDHAAGLPSSGLLFPLSVRQHDGEQVVRTLLSVDAAAGSITFAGDVPEGCHARLMRGNLERLIDGAEDAAQAATTANDAVRLALLVSCIGRRLVLKQRTEDEIDAVRAVLGPKTMLTGLYSNGELCPNAAGRPCALQNQTMTITTFGEI